MALSVDNFNLLIKYLSASENLKTSKSDIEAFLNKYGNNNFIQYLKDIYETSVDEKLIIDLLLVLNIPLDQWVLYLSSPMSLYDLLNELSQNAQGTFTQVPWLLDRIENKTLYKKLKDLLSLLIPVLLILIIPFLYWASEALILLDLLLQTAYIIPLTGIGSALSTLVLSLYFNKTNLRTPKHKIMVDYYFLLASNALNIAGKLFIMFRQVTILPIAQYLFIASSLVNVIKHIYHLQALYREKKVLGDCEPSSSILIYQSYARLHFQCLKQRNELIISMISAALVTTLVFSCLILPPGVLFTVAISSSTLLVYLIEQVALKINEKIMSSLLHTNLAEIATWRIEEKDRENRLKETGKSSKVKETASPRTMHLKKLCSVANFNTQPATLRAEPSLERLQIYEKNPYSYLTNSQRSLSSIKKRIINPSALTDSNLNEPPYKKSHNEKLHHFFKYYCPENEQMAALQSLSLS